MNFGDLKPTLEHTIKLLKDIERHLKCSSCGGTDNITTGGTTGPIPAGMKTVTIVKTSTAANSVIIGLSDATTYTLTEQWESFTETAPVGGVLPAYTFGGAGSFKWHGIK